MSALSTALGIISSRVRGRALARRLARQSHSITPIAMYFADAPSNLYQLRRWYATLEALSTTHATSIVLSDPVSYSVVRRETTLPVSFAMGAPDLGRVFAQAGVRVILYANHSALNFRVLRFADPVHVFVGHGESAKDSSVSRQLKAYDLDFVADSASLEQLRNIRGFDVENSAIVSGAPWLGLLGPPPQRWYSDDRRVVVYAPTWEGDRPTMDYSSVETFGENIVATVLGAPKLRLIYRPHPWLGRVRAASASADAKIRRAIASADRDDVVDTGAYGWALAVADVCITDVSSVAFDARALGKPVIVTVPTSPTVLELTDSAFAGMTRLDVTNASVLSALIDAACAEPPVPSHSVDNSMQTFVSAIDAALTLQATSAK